MTRTETIQVLSILKAAYPSFYKDREKPELESVIGLWCDMFTDETVAEVGTAVKMHIASDERGFPPHIGAIKKAIDTLRHPDTVTEMEAWTLVSRAIRNSGYNSRSEFERLPGDIQRLVGSPTQLHVWAMMDEDDVESVIQSNFMRSYKARTEAERQYRRLPSDVRAIADALGNKLALSDGESEEHNAKPT